MKKFSYFLLTAVVGLTGCQSYEPELTATSGDTGVADTYDEIISRANLYYGMLPGKTRATAPAVSDVMPILTGNTRATENVDETPVYYIVNYENEEGFVIVGGNDVSEPMVAISDEGNFSLTDTIGNKNLASFIKGLDTPTAVIDTLMPPPVYKPDVSVAPIIDAKVRKWGPGSPFNAQVPWLNTSTGERAKVDCAAIAAAMIMSCYESPLQHNGRSLNWDNIIGNYYSSDLAYILADLGSAPNLATNYGKETPMSNPEYFKRAFNNYEYNYPSSSHPLTQFSVETRNSVIMQLPLLVYGYYNESSKIGHAWVIDGLLHLQTVNIRNNTTKSTYYFHCVWGDYGRANGYFKKEDVNKIGGTRHSKGTGDGTYSGYQDTDTTPIYNTDVNYLQGVRPLPQKVEM